MPYVFVALTILSAFGVLLAERRQSQRGKWVCKPLAAVGFVGAALTAGAMRSTYGELILLALLLSAAGDVALIPKGTGWPFRIGMLAFLLAHASFITAFSTRANLTVSSAIRIAGCLVVFGLAAVPLVRRSPPRLRIPVILYAIAVSSMAATASVTGSPRLATAGVLFLASDVFVALHRFTTPRFLWKVIALPLYYGAEIVFALSVR